jgi:hypothetical protein
MENQEREMGLRIGVVANIESEWFDIVSKLTDDPNPNLKGSGKILTSMRSLKLAMKTAREMADTHNQCVAIKGGSDPAYFIGFQV